MKLGSEITRPRRAMKLGLYILWVGGQNFQKAEF